MDWATDHHVFIYLVLPLNGYPDELDARILSLVFSFLSLTRFDDLFTDTLSCPDVRQLYALGVGVVTVSMH